MSSRNSTKDDGSIPSTMLQKRSSVVLSLKKERDQKRLQMEDLFEQQQVLMRQMSSLEEELQDLDDKITVVERDIQCQKENPTASVEMETDKGMGDDDDSRSERKHFSLVQQSVLQVKRQDLSDTPTSRQDESESAEVRFEFNRPCVPGPASAGDPSSLETQNVHYPWDSKVSQLLRETFNIQSFRENQKRIIDTTLQGEDVFVIMRTGGGKSLTYQLPALLEGRGPGKKVTLVVSPLLSLIRDQEEQMNQFAPGSAVSFTSNMPGGQKEHTRRWNLVRDDNAGVVLLIVTPERVHQSSKLRGELEKLHEKGRLGRFVIDECHCASQWGHDFRPDYTQLGVLKRHFPEVPLLAVTATASDSVRHDCCRLLNMSSDYRFFRSTFRRPNLTYSVQAKMDSKEKVVDQLSAFIKENHEGNAGIVYTFSRKEAEEVAGKLCDRGIIAEAYHSSVTGSMKENVHQSWMRNDTQVVVATIAFGLGINKPDGEKRILGVVRISLTTYAVRFVIHHSMSRTLESYYQESGRAGRDGRPADCLLLYSPRDVPRVLSLVHGQNSEPAFYPMVSYGQACGNDAICKAIVMKKLGEPNSPDVEEVFRENEAFTTDLVDVGKHAKTVVTLLERKIQDGEPVTLAMLVKEWRGRSPMYEFLASNPPNKDLTVDDCERVVIALLLERVMIPKVVWNMYGSAVYLELGSNGRRLLVSPSPEVLVRLPKRQRRVARANSVSKKRKPSFDRVAGKSKKRQQRATTTRRTDSTEGHPGHVITLDESDDDDESVATWARRRKITTKQT